MSPSLFNLLGYACPVVMALLVAGAITHSLLASRKTPPRQPPRTWKIIVLCLFHGLIATGVYWHLITGGWLTSEHYQWGDPNNINLVLAVFEAMAVATAIMLLALKKRFVYLLAVDFMVVQLLLVAVMGALLVLFILTWKPGMY